MLVASKGDSISSKSQISFNSSAKAVGGESSAFGFCGFAKQAGSIKG